MAINKTATLTFRIAPELKDALREAASRDASLYCKYGGSTDPTTL